MSFGTLQHQQFVVIAGGDPADRDPDNVSSQSFDQLVYAPGPTDVAGSPV